MQDIIRTVYGAELQTATLLNIPLNIKPYSTLNEKFSVHDNVTIADTDRPSLKYIAIGNGGHRVSTGANNLAKLEPVSHSPRNAALYNHLPFIMRAVGSDLTAEERINYRLRKQVTYDGITYIAYYLKVLDLAATNPLLELRVIEDGVTSSSEFIPNASDLNPTPPAINSGQVLTTSGDYIAATAKVPFIMTEEDITEFLNVCNIIYGDDSYSMISELAICSGIDKIVPGNFNGTTVNYLDAIGVQVINFINTSFPAKYTNSGINMLFDIGSIEPLLVLS